MNPLNFSIKQYLLWLIVSILIPFNSGMANTQNIKTIVIFPFETNSHNDISYITAGAWNMLYSRISWRDHVRVIDRHKLSGNLDNLTATTANEQILKIAQDTSAEYVMTGSITEFANAFSLDVKLYDIKNRSYLTFYDQTAKIDQVIQKINIISAKINKKVFDRTTTTFEKMEKEKLISAEELKRIHPEQMMPIHQDKTDDPWWKFW
ncbi:hypothetical protein [Desulfobacula phenolica]|uniref:Uncharacterized protein n=1 Tax=Desulfobacula phenolica TaxID=90732 RepID=A0A1H2HHU7_9BACT|nr:hypothetical protein [Desulfobacula phenolica]SDU31362.1 hypothetical protein SAMN04487931_106251 [Desulfobacula phenolica]